ncbi:ABC transporter ATP-binding protein [bacterium]|nr:ABC transporter ATP-binding protein [bacterium]
MSEEILLDIRRLSTAFEVEDVIIPILKDITFRIHSGESLGVVGESGSGKSVLAHAIMGLLPSNAQVYNGEIIYEGRDLLKLNPKKRRQLRGDRMAMIFQEPMTSLNPVYTVGSQVVELIRAHRKISKKEALAWAVDIFEKVGIPQSNDFANRYPHELSGGMRQRVVIALAIALSPVLLLADEPTTALDVSIQAQILELIQSLQDNMKMATMLITHDLGVVAGMCRNVLVMYAGQVVETGETEELFKFPKHPYTKALLKSIPKLDQNTEFLETIKGMVPHPQRMPEGCRFAPRCEVAMDQCHREEPDMHSFSEYAGVKCWLYQ